MYQLAYLDEVRSAKVILFYLCLGIGFRFSRNTLPCYDLSFYVQSTILSDKSAKPYQKC